MAVTRMSDTQWMVEVSRFGSDKAIRLQAQFVVEVGPSGLVIQPWRMVHSDTSRMEEYPLPCTREIREFYEPMVILELFRPLVDTWVAYKDPNRVEKKSTELDTIKKLFGRGGGK